MRTTSAAGSGNTRRIRGSHARRALVLAFCAWFLAFPPLASAGFLDVQWDEPTTSADATPLTDLAGYRLYWGTTTPACPGTGYLFAAAPIPNPGPGRVFLGTLTNLTPGTTYFVRVTAVDTSGNESTCTPAVSGPARPDLSVTPASLSFGNVNVGSTATLDLTVQNQRSTPLTGSASVAAPFSIVSGASLNLAAGASQTVRVQFAPTSAQTYAGNVTITTDGDDVSRAVSGSGISAPTVLQFSQASSSVTEGGTATITVTRTGGTQGGVTVQYTTGGGSATAGTDYTAASGTLSFGSGQMSRTFTVGTLADTAVEATETVILTLSNPQGATLGTPAQATLNITDDDVAGTVQLGAAAYTVAEGAGSVTVNVTRTGGSASGVTVNYATANGTATAGSDYTSRSGTLTFAAGATTLPITVPILQDSTVEPSETFTVTLSGPGGGAVLGAATVTTVTITDDEPTLVFSAATYTGAETAGTATITVNRVGSTTGAVTVNYATTGSGSAVGGSDFTPVSGTLSFAAGQASRTFTVAVLDDDVVDGPRTVGLALSSPTGAALGTPSTATLTITDSDSGGTIQFGAATYSVAEGTGSVMVNVTRTGGTAAGVTVSYATASGTALAGNDYTTTAGTLTFGAGVTSLPISVPILEEATPEPSETFTVTLSSPAGGASLGATSVTTVTITDSPTLVFSAATYTGAETAGTVTITVNRVGSTAGASTVGYATTGTGSATPGAGGDFTPVSGTLSFAAGQGSRTFMVPVLVDGVVDGPKTVGLVLTSPAGSVLGTPSTATLTITDSDAGGTLQLGAAAYTAAEGAGNATVNVTRTGGSAGGVTVSYTTANGSATAGADYTAQSGTLTFGAGVTTLPIVVPILQDATPEPSETFTLTLSSTGGGGVLGTTTVTTVTITDDEPALRFSAASYSVSESAGTATITVSRVGGTTGAVTVDYATTAGGTAVPGPGGDYTPVAGTLTLATGQASGTFVVPILDDDVVDGARTVGLALSSPTGAALGTPSTATLTITDSDAGGTIQFAPATATVAEGAGSVTVTVTRTGGTAAGVTVNYATANGSATAGADYDIRTGTLTFGAGVTSLPITVPVLSDATLEPSETFTVMLSSPGAGAALGVATVATVTITDDDSSLAFSAATYTSAETAGTATITVNRVGSTAAAATVDYATTGAGTATPGAGGDYTPVSGTLTFAAGQASRTFTVPVLDDDVVDGPKTVGLVLTSPSGAVLGTPSTATLTLTDSDAGGTIQFATATYTVAESAGSLTIDVTRTGGAAGAVTVSYATANGTATAGADYGVRTGTLTFGAGVTSQTITVPILEEATPEPAETFTLALSSPGGGATLGTRTLTTVTITDSPTLVFSAASYTAAETAGTVTITVSRVGGTAGTATVDYATTGAGTATPGPGGDYTPVSGTLTFTGGQTSRTFTVPVLDDTVVDGAKTVGLVLTGPSGAVLGTLSGATLTITDNDGGGTIQLAAASYTVAEGAGSLTVTVTRTGGTAAGVTVNYATANGTATAGADYTAQTGTLTFGAGVTTLPLSVPVLQDATPEPAETFMVMLSSPGGGGALGTTTAATVTITDDEPSLVFGAAGYTAAETAGTATITVNRVGSTAGAVTVDYATTTSGTATPGPGGDYTPVSGTLTFAAGQASRTFTVPILDDDLVDGSRTVSLALTNPTGAGLGTPSTATLTITDNDGTITVQFASATYSVSESAGSVTVDVTRTGGTAGVVTVSYGTGFGTAIAGGDYGVRSGTLTFGAGVTTLPITVPIFLDATPELGETFTVALNGPGGGATLGTPAVTTVTINDASSLLFSSTVYSVAETVGAATITVNRVGSTAGAVTVDYATTGGPATPGPGGDYTPVSGTLTFAAGQASRTFTVPILDDDVMDGSKMVGLALTNAVGAGLGSPSAATLVITDNDTAGAIRVATSSYTVAEGAGSVTITVSRTGGTASGVSVDYATADGTATAGADYGARTGTLSFGPGVTTLPITVPILQDATPEPAETFTLTLSNPGGGGTLGPATVATVTITDDEPTLRFSTTSYSVGEAAGTATIAVSRVGGTSGSVTVDYATTTGGTAVAGPGGDYTPVSGTLTLAAGQASGTFAVPILDDDVVDGPRTVGLVLTSPTGATLGTPSAATLTITDNDTPGTLQFASAGYTAGEGAGSVTVNVTRTGGTAAGVTVGYTTANGTATAGDDYTAQAGTLSFGPGLATVPIVIPILQDSLAEGAHAFTVALSSPTGGALLGAPSVTTVTIVDDETGMSLRFSAATYTAAETAGQATITVTRVGGTTGVVTVDYATTSGGTAVPGPGGDYTPVSGTLSFAAGQASRTFTVPVLDDDVADGPRTVALVLQNPVGALLGAPNTATLTLTDNDVAGSIQFSAPQYWVDEGGGTVNVMVTRTGGTAAGASATYAITGGTAAPGSDFLTAGAGTMTFARGVTSMTIPITLTGDTQLEGTETLELTLANPGGGALLGANRRAMVMIEETTFQFAPAVYTVTEGGVATVTVTRTGPVTRGATVDWTIGDGTAVAGTDYNAGAGTLSFPAGMRSRTFTVSTLSDTVVEPSETVLLTLRNPSPGAILGTQRTAALTITDNDFGGRIAFSPASHTVAENRGGLNVPVVRSGGVASGVTVAYAITGGTAAGGGVDYILTSGTLTFAAGQTTALIPIVLVDDGLAEPDETIVLQLSAPTGGATLGTPSIVTVKLTDDDRTSTLQLSAAALTVVEGAGAATVTVTRTGSTTMPVSVLLATSNGTARAGVDYTAVSTPVVFDAKVTSRTVTIPIIPNAAVDGTRTVNLTLTGATAPAALGATATAVLSILDDDSVLALGASSYALTEGGTVAITVRRTGSALGTVSAGYQVTGLTAGPSDYVPASGRLTFGPGVMSQTLTVRTLVDPLVEGSETVQVALGAPLGQATLGTPATAVVTITDAPPAVRFGAAAYTVTESTPTATITVMRSGPSTGTVTVDYAVAGGTATGGGVDYLVAPGTLTFAPGVASRTFTVAIANDTLPEVPETVLLQLSSPSGAVVGAPGTTTLTLQDNEPVLRFGAATYTVGEATAAATITVLRSGLTTVPVTVNYAVSGGTATGGGVDYAVNAGTLSFEPGVTSRTFTVAIRNDGLAEGPETVSFSLSGATGAAIGSPATTTLTIVDDEPLLRFAAAAYTVSEATPALTLTVLRSGTTTGTVTVNYGVSGGTAAASQDYTLAAGTLTFGPGVTSRTFTLALANDTLVESVETLVLALSNPVNASLGTPATTTVSITSADDAGGRIQFASPVFTQDEGGGTATITVTRVSGLASAVTVDVATLDGTALAGTHYVAVATALTFVAGQSSVTVPVPLLDNGSDGAARWLSLVLSQPGGGGTLGTPSAAVLWIADDD